MHLGSLKKLRESIKSPRLALGAASASCLHKEGATYEVDKATEIAAEIQVTEQKIV